MKSEEEERSNIEKLRSIINLQAKQIESFKLELKSLKKELDRVSQFPKFQLILLKKYNGIITSRNAICFVVLQGYPFALLTGKVMESLKGKAEVKITVNFEDSTQNIEVGGKVLKLKCGIALLEINREVIPKALQEHCLVLDELRLKQRSEIGTKIVAYIPGLELITGFVMSDKLKSDGELRCQLHVEEAYSGSLVFDEYSLPIGICAGLKGMTQNQGNTSHLEISSMFPLTIKIPSITYCKVLDISIIISELSEIIHSRIKEETKRAEVLNDGRFMQHRRENE